MLFQKSQDYNFSLRETNLIKEAWNKHIFDTRRDEAGDKDGGGVSFLVAFLSS